MTVITTGVKDGSLGTRIELGALLADSDLTNVYLLGLARMQAVDPADLRSWFQIAGIHGRPYAPYDGVGQDGGFGGYCTHSSTIFPTWHRPYLALFEQVLTEHVRAAAAEFQGADRDRFTAAAARFRIPYWDWAADADLPTLVSEQETVTVTTPSGPRTIANPLYAYVFPRAAEQHLADGLPDERTWENYRETVRYPAGQNSQPKRMEAQLANNRLTLRDRTYNLLTQSNDWAGFSTDAPQDDNASPQTYDSLESIHNQIHGLTGNNGHMGIVDFAAFDPVFWLHHCNVDRILTIWQGINPNVFVTPRENDAGTFTTPAGTVEDAESPLSPFRLNPNDFWTSTGSRDTRTFGYTYPELAQWANLSADQKRTRLRTTVNQLYGRTAPSTALRTTGSGTANKPWGAVSAVAAKPAPAPPQPAAPAQPAQPPRPAQPPAQPAPVAKPQPAAPPAPVPVHAMPEPTAQQPFSAPATAQAVKPVHHDASAQPVHAATAPTPHHQNTAFGDLFRSAATSLSGHGDLGKGAADFLHQAAATADTGATVSAGWLRSTADTVKDKTANGSTAEFGGSLADWLHSAAGTIEGGGSVSAADFQRLGQQGARVLAKLPGVIPGHTIRGHAVREYIEWVCNVKVEKHAVQNTFFVHVFLGDFNPNPTSWATEKNLVGSHVIFTSSKDANCDKCQTDRARKLLVTGTIPLTGALGDHFGSVYDLTPERVSPYLTKNLHWRLTKTDGTELPRESMPSLKVSVGHTKVEVPDAEDEFPIWKNIALDLSVTAGRPGGAQHAHEA